MSRCDAGCGRSTDGSASSTASAAVSGEPAYLEVDPSLVWEHLGRLDDLRAFAASVEASLEGD